PERRVVLGGAEVGGVAGAGRALDRLDPHGVKWVLHQAVVVEGVGPCAAGAGGAARAFAEADAGLLVGELLGELPRLLGVLRLAVDADEVGDVHAAALAGGPLRHKRVLDDELVLDARRYALRPGAGLEHRRAAGDEEGVLVAVRD